MWGQLQIHLTSSSHRSSERLYLVGCVYWLLGSMVVITYIYVWSIVVNKNEINANVRGEWHNIVFQDVVYVLLCSWAPVSLHFWSDPSHKPFQTYFRKPLRDIALYKSLPNMVEWVELRCWVPLIEDELQQAGPAPIKGILTICGLCRCLNVISEICIKKKIGLQWELLLLVVLISSKDQPPCTSGQSSEMVVFGRPNLFPHNDGLSCLLPITDW